MDPPTLEDSPFSDNKNIALLAAASDTLRKVEERGYNQLVLPSILL